MSPFMMLMFSVAMWTLAYAFEVGSIDLARKIFWAKVKYLGVVAVPTMWLYLAVKYLGQEKWLTPQYTVWFLLEPIITLLLVWSNDLHGLMWSSLRLEKVGPLYLKVSTHGLWWWIHTSYSYLLLLAGTALFIRRLIRSHDLYRSQVVLILTGAISPWIGNAMYISGFNPLVPLDLTPFGFTITGLSISWGLFRAQLFDILPIARSAILENMKDAVIVLDIQNRIADLNRAACEIIGCQPAETIGKKVTSVSTDWQPLIVQYDNLSETNDEISIGHDDSKRYYNLDLSSVYDRKGHYKGRIILLRDITEVKAAALELEEAKLKAESSSRAKSEFLANMSHELRTPLNHIIGFTELVMDKKVGNLNEVQEKYLKNVHQSSKHLLSLVNDVLDLSKVEAGKLELTSRVIDLKKALESSYRLIRDEAIKNGIELTMTVDNIPEKIKADERKLKQILYNLLSNAVKFTPDGGKICLAARAVDCTVRSGRRQEDSENLRIIEKILDRKEAVNTQTKKFIEVSVSDNGIGIEPANQKRIFNPFDQLESSATRRFAGTGLGLSLSRKLVELHGGKIWVESEGEGKGSKFLFIIPA